MILLLLLACRAAPAGNMGERFVGGLEQPQNLAPGWRCDVWRGIMDRVQGGACFEASGPAEDADGPIYPLMYGPPWYPPGLADGWACAEWRLDDPFYISACYPMGER